MAATDRVRAGSRAAKLTYDDFVRFPDDGKRHELIDGQHYVTPSPNTKHQRVLGRLHLMIGGWLLDHPTGEAFSLSLRCRVLRLRRRRARFVVSV